jgi:RNase P subunit RPR2
MTQRRHYLPKRSGIFPALEVARRRATMLLTVDRGDGKFASRLLLPGVAWADQAHKGFSMLESGRKIERLKYDAWIGLDEFQNELYQRIGILHALRIDKSRQVNLWKQIRSHTCPYCNSTLRTALNESTDFEPDSSQLASQCTVSVKACPDCGFWRRFASDSVFGTTYEVPAVKAFQTDTITPSILQLAAEIKLRNDLVYSMEPYRFERFVGAVLSEYYGCDVRHVGRSKDDCSDSG